MKEFAVFTLTINQPPLSSPVLALGVSKNAPSGKSRKFRD
jgi:hypothetical protein